MFQTVLLFLAPAQGISANGQSANGQSSADATSGAVHASPDRAGKACTCMASRNQPAAARGWLLRTSGLWSGLWGVAGNALGFIVFMSGLGMVLRLVEMLLP